MGVLIRLFQNTAKCIKVIGSGAKFGIGLTGKIVSLKYPKTGEYVNEVGSAFINSAVSVIDNTAVFTDGAIQLTYGAAKKDAKHLSNGKENVKTSVVNTGKGLSRGLIFTGTSTAQTIIGALTRDKSRFVEGIKGVGKATVVITTGASLFDSIDVFENVLEQELVTINANLDGKSHEVTGVLFEKREIELDKNNIISGVYPVFETQFETSLTEASYQMSDSAHIRNANMQLLDEIESNPRLAKSLGFDADDIKDLNSSITPAGYDWHHNEVPGVMQLVNEFEHGQTAHTGGRFVWGGGSEFR